MNAAATIFLGALAKNAADDLWKNKSNIASALLLKPVKKLHDFARSTHTAEASEPNRTAFNIALPIPDDMWATYLELPRGSLEDLAIHIALFVNQVREIEAIALEVVASGDGPVGVFLLSVLANGEIEMTWQSEGTGARQVRRIARPGPTDNQNDGS